MVASFWEHSAAWRLGHRKSCGLSDNSDGVYKGRLADDQILSDTEYVLYTKNTTSDGVSPAAIEAPCNP